MTVKRAHLLAHNTQNIQATVPWLLLSVEAGVYYEHQVTRSYAMLLVPAVLDMFQGGGGLILSSYLQL